MNIGNKIKELRIKAEMTQEELAQKIGYKSRSSINKIELGERKVTQVCKLKLPLYPLPPLLSLQKKS